MLVRNELGSGTMNKAIHPTTTGISLLLAVAVGSELLDIERAAVESTDHLCGLCHVPWWHSAATLLLVALVVAIIGWAVRGGCPLRVEHE